MNLDVLVKAIRKDTALSELYKLNERYPGVLYKFWRLNSPNPFFPQWLDMMENREAVSKKKKKPITLKAEDSSTFKKVKETDMERVTRQLKEIQEKYS